MTTTKYYAALNEGPVLTEPTFDEVMARVDGVIVERDQGWMQAFWATKGAWGQPGPSAAGAVLGWPSNTYVSEVTRRQAEQLLAKLSPSATLPH